MPCLGCRFLDSTLGQGHPIQSSVAQLRDKLLHARRLARLADARTIILQDTFDPLEVADPLQVRP